MPPGRVPAGALVTSYPFAGQPRTAAVPPPRVAIEGVSSAHHVLDMAIGPVGTNDSGTRRRWLAAEEFTSAWIQGRDVGVL